MYKLYFMAIKQSERLVYACSCIHEKHANPKGLSDFTLSVKETFSFSRMQTEHCIYQKTIHRLFDW